MAKADDPYTRLTATWGVPDPRNLNGYPDVASTSPTQWAWELLRRREDYREQWRETIEPYLLPNGEFDPDRWQETADKIRREAMAAHKSSSIEPPWKTLARRFHLSETMGNQDPRRSDPPSFAAHTVSVGSWLEQKGTQERHRDLSEKLLKMGLNPPVRLPPELEEFKVSVEIDVSLPLGPQLSRIEQILHERYVPKVPPDKLLTEGRIQFDKFPRYLRLLDFETAAGLEEVIAKALFPNIKGEPLRDQLRKSREAARYWQGQYLRIAASGAA